MTETVRTSETRADADDSEDDAAESGLLLLGLLLGLLPRLERAAQHSKPA